MSLLLSCPHTASLCDSFRNATTASARCRDPDHRRSRFVILRLAAIGAGDPPASRGRIARRRCLIRSLDGERGPTLFAREAQPPYRVRVVHHVVRSQTRPAFAARSANSLFMTAMGLPFVRASIRIRDPQYDPTRWSMPSKARQLSDYVNVRIFPVRPQEVNCRVRLRQYRDICESVLDHADPLDTMRAAADVFHRPEGDHHGQSTPRIHHRRRRCLFVECSMERDVVRERGEQGVE